MAKEKLQRDTRWVKALDTEYLQCRSMLHAWKIESFRLAETEEQRALKGGLLFKQVIKRDLTCLRCGTVRTDFFGRVDARFPFEKIRSRYAYPQGYRFYQAEHKLDRPMSADFHTALYERMTSEVSG